MNDELESLILGRRLVEPEQLQEALRLRAKFAADGMELSLEEVLLKKGWITPEQAQSLDPGREGRIAGFEILSTLGRGGMGVVYKARQTSMDRIVALKVLLPEYSREKGFIDRFLREARAVARLNHPHIVAGYDAGSAGGIHYTVMEYVEGETLDARLAREQKLPWKEALRIVRQIAQALDHAQGAGLIHRDIKPSNIMLAADGTAKLLDLGMARATGEGEASLTLTGHVVGTPKYMSPEQASGDKSIDIRADLYSLGITLYEMLSGAVPFTGSNPMAILHKHVHEGVRFAIPGIPAGVLSLGHRLTERNRLKRCPSPAQLIAEIDRLGDGAEPLRPVTRRIPVVRRSSRSGLWFALGGAAGLLLLAGVFLPSRPSRPVPPKVPPRAEPLAVLPSAPEPAPQPEPKPEAPKPVEPVPPKPLPAPVPKPPPAAEPESKPKPEPPPAPTPAPEPAPKGEDRDAALVEAFASELQARAGRRDYLKIDAAPPAVATAEGKRRLEESLEAARLAREVWLGARDWIRGLRGKPAIFETRQGRKVAGMVEAVANDDQMYVKEQVYATADLAPASLAAFYGLARGKAAKPEAAAALAAYEGDLALAEETLKKARATAPPGVEALLAVLRARKAETATRARELKEAEALLKAGRLEELVQLYPSSPAAATARERLAAKKASERKVVARWTFGAGVEGWTGTPAAGALQGLPSNDSYNLSACGLSSGGFPAWNSRYRLRFDYRINSPVSLKIQIHPESSAVTGTVWAQLDRAEAGAWRTLDRRLGEFGWNKEPAPGDKIANFYIMAGFSDRTPELLIDNVEVYDPGEGKK